jgi:hypothetical protein
MWSDIRHAPQSLFERDPRARIALRLVCRRLTECCAVHHYPLDNRSGRRNTCIIHLGSMASMPFPASIASIPSRDHIQSHKSPRNRACQERRCLGPLRLADDRYLQILYQVFILHTSRMLIESGCNARRWYKAAFECKGKNDAGHCTTTSSEHTSLVPIMPSHFPPLLLMMAALVSTYPTAKTDITLPSAPPAGAASPVPMSFLSYSIEFSSFPDFAGRKAWVQPRPPFAPH